MSRFSDSLRQSAMSSDTRNVAGHVNTSNLRSGRLRMLGNGQTCTLIGFAGSKGFQDQEIPRYFVFVFSRPTHHVGRNLVPDHT